AAVVPTPPKAPINQSPTRRAVMSVRFPRRPAGSTSGSQSACQGPAVEVNSTKGQAGQRVGAGVERRYYNRGPQAAADKGKASSVLVILSAIVPRRPGGVKRRRILSAFALRKHALSRSKRRQTGDGPHTTPETPCLTRRKGSVQSTKPWGSCGPGA